MLDDVLIPLSLDEEGKFVPILQDLVMYDFPKLAVMAANLLIRHHTQIPELMSGLQQVQILIHDSHVKTYQLLQTKLESLRNWQMLQMDEAFGILLFLAQQCTKKNDQSPVPEHQRILHNLSAHEIVVEILPLKPPLKSNPVHKPMIEIIKMCMKFLMVRLCYSCGVSSILRGVVWLFTSYP